jgi:hypothetical protein
MATSNASENLGDGPTEDASPEHLQNTVTSYAARMVPILWGLLGLFFLSLVAMAVVLLVRAGFFSNGKLSNQQTNSVWAFLGVAFGAVVTLFGALLTEQHNRRTAAITKEAADRSDLATTNQQRLAEEAEKRLEIDTVAKVLQLITQNGGYAKRARVAGAIATLVQLQAGPVAVRILGELWKEDAVDSDTAVWLIDRIVERQLGDAQENLADVVSLLVYNAGKLVPSPARPDHTWSRWPRSAAFKWPSDLPDDARRQFIEASISLLASRNLEWWARFRGHCGVIEMLTFALDDPIHGERAGAVLSRVVDLGGGEVFGIDESVRRRLEEYDHFDWSWMDDRFEGWRRADADRRGALRWPWRESSPFGRRRFR